MIVESLHDIRRRILAVCQRSGRDSRSVRLLAVSKRQPLDRVIQYLGAFLPGEVPTLGENYVQEYRDKRAALVHPHRAHLIGSLQRNKAREAVRLFDVVETVDSSPLAQVLSSEAEKVGKTLEVLIQVNISGDGAKSGVPASGVLSLAREVAQLPRLALAGVMTVTRIYPTAEGARLDFRALRLLGDTLLADERLRELGFKRCELSMGMSSDFEVAIEEGATEVRIGSALFGARE